MFYEYNGRLFYLKAVSDLFTYVTDIKTNSELRLFNSEFRKLNRI